MLHEGAVFKVLLVPGVVWLVADFLPKLLHVGWVTMLAIGGIAAGVGGAGYLFRLCRRAWRKARGVLRRMIEIIESTPERFDAIEERFKDGETHFARIDDHLARVDKSLDVIAEANASRVDDAIAGDERKPRVDRRRAA